jgi:outer membrane lipoprotein SlyB
LAAFSTKNCRRGTRPPEPSPPSSGGSPSLGANEEGKSEMKVIKTARVLTLGAMLPFAAFAVTSASAGDDDKEGGALKGAAKGAAIGAVVPGVSAKTGATVGAVSGAIKKNNKDDKEEKKDD